MKVICLIALLSVVIHSCLPTRRMTSKSNLTNVFPELNVVSPQIFVHRLPFGAHYTIDEVSELKEDTLMQKALMDTVFSPLLQSFCHKNNLKFTSIDSLEKLALRQVIYDDLHLKDKKKKILRLLLLPIGYGYRSHVAFKLMFPLNSSHSESFIREKLESLKAKTGNSKLLFFHFFGVYQRTKMPAYTSISMQHASAGSLPNELVSIGIFNLKTQQVEYLINNKTSHHSRNSYMHKDAYLKYLNELKGL